jgi:hypothetical protein
MIIRNFDVFHAIIRPHKTNAELIVDPYAVLTLPVMFKRFQKVPGWNLQGFQGNGSVKLVELSLCDSPDLLWTSLSGSSCVLSVENILGSLAAERFYHRTSFSRTSSVGLIITDTVIYGNS